MRNNMRKRNPYLIGADVIGQAVPSPSSPMFIPDPTQVAPTMPPPVPMGPTMQPNPFYAAAATQAANRLATLQAALAQGQAQRAQASAALAQQLAQSQPASTDPSSAAADPSTPAQTVSGYLRGADILGAAPMRPTVRAITRAPAVVKAPVSSSILAPMKSVSNLVSSASSGLLKIMTPSKMATPITTPVVPVSQPIKQISSTFAATAAGAFKAEQAAAAAAAAAATPGPYQFPTTGLAPTAENPNNPTTLMNGQPNPNPPNPSNPGYLMNGQIDPYAPNAANPSLTLSGQPNPNPPNPSNPSLLMNGAINPYYQQEMAAGGLANTAAAAYGASPYGSSGGYGGDSGGGGGGGGGDDGSDDGVDWGDGSDGSDGSGDDGSGDGMDDGSGDNSQPSFDPSQTPFAMATGFGNFGGGDGGGGGDQLVDQSSFGGDTEFAQDAETAAEQEQAQESNIDWGDGSSNSISGDGDTLGALGDLIGDFNIATEQDKFNAQGPLTVAAAQAALVGGLAAINHAISVSNSKNLPGPTERQNVLGKLNWHAAAIGKLTSTPNAIYPSWSDLEKYVMDAFEDSNSVDEGASEIDGAKDAMWRDIATAQSAREMAGQAYDAVSAAAAGPSRRRRLRRS